MVSAKRKAAIVRAVKKRRLKVKELAINYKGGKCNCCGYDRCKDSLEFHHVEKDGKGFGISAKGYTRSWESIKSELNKCVLLCANCHREWHAGIIDENDLSFFGSLNEIGIPK